MTPEQIDSKILSFCNGGSTVRDMARHLNCSENVMRAHCHNLVNNERLRAKTSGKEIRYFLPHHLPNLRAHDPFGLAQGAHT